MGEDCFLYDWHHQIGPATQKSYWPIIPVLSLVATFPRHPNPQIMESYRSWTALSPSDAYLAAASEKGISWRGDMGILFLRIWCLGLEWGFLSNLVVHSR